MLTRSVILATTLTVGLVAGVGSSALAIALVPGDESGTTQHVQAIAAASQDPSEGASSSFLNGVPVTVTLPTPIAIDGRSDQPAAEADSPAEVPTSEPAAEPTGNENGNSGNVNSGNGNGNSGNGNSGQSAEDKAKKDKENEDDASDQ